MGLSRHSLGDALGQETNGWCGRLALDFAARPDRTVLVRKRQQGPLTVQRPFYPEGAPCHVYLLHPPGGVVGGDRLETRVEIGEGAHALLTTPGATKLYRSAGMHALVRQRLRIAPGGVLEWLPQETILFPGALAHTRTEVELDPGARFIGWEIQCLGRPASGERFTEGRADIGLSVTRGGTPLIDERLRIAGAAALDGPSGLRGHPITATLIATGADAEDLRVLRANLSTTDARLWGATLVADLLIVRCLADRSEPVRGLFVSVWGILRPRLLGRAVCAPRIWAT